MGQQFRKAEFLECSWEHGPIGYRNQLLRAQQSLRLGLLKSAV
jgi:hypothetical protein